MRLQDDVFKYNGYLSLPEVRERCLQQLQKFVGARLFSVRDYNESEWYRPSVPLRLRCYRPIAQ